jgi:hypothetical protein
MAVQGVSCPLRHTDLYTCQALIALRPFESQPAGLLNVGNHFAEGQGLTLPRRQGVS